MAIAKIKKIEVIGLDKDRDSLLSLLQRQGKVQLIDAQPPEAGPLLPAVSSDSRLLGIEEAISFLSTCGEKAGFLAGIISLKPVVYQQELKEMVATFPWQDLLEELSGLRNRLRELAQHKERLLQKSELLEAWEGLRIPLDYIQPTHYCGILLGMLSSHDCPKAMEEIEKQDIKSFSQIVSQDRTETHLVLIYSKEDFPRLEAILKDCRFTPVAFGPGKGSIEDNLTALASEVRALEKEIGDVQGKIVQMAKEQFKLKMLYDYLANTNRVQEADRSLARQQYTFCLRGWVRQRDIPWLEREISREYPESALFISDPGLAEEVPVVLENRWPIRPFEFITQIYGMPQYHEIDPTPFLAPFFFLYFGFCVSDVGYGLILVLFSWCVLKKLKMGPQGTRFWWMFLFCGISTIIVGALTGSWFGNLFDLLGEGNVAFLPLKRFKDSLVILDPLKEPTRLLGLALCLGVIQVWFGNIVAAIGNIKNRRYLDVVLDQVPMLVFLFGLTGLGLVFLGLGDAGRIGLFKNAALGAGVMLVLTQGRAEKGLGAKLFYGIYNLYNAFSGYLSDILSYSRLWALGLVTGVMASTINLIAVQFSQLVPSVLPIVDKIVVLKIVLSTFVLAVIFVFGHAVSFLMNLLGAFVHPLRLQFVEFFSKFFKSGGSTFKPFRIETKYIRVD